ncbi:MAG TPA: hypothetical protein VIC87_12475, partial [Vicinamibacteria bacterium]
MSYALDPDRISDDDLLRRLHALLVDSRATESDLVAHIGEVDARRLYAREAAPSMHLYCTKVLHLSDAEAFLRITAARAARAYPLILEMLADGRLHLSAISRLAPHLTAENQAELLLRAVHKTRREVEELVAGLDPRPDAPTVVRKLPAKSGPEGPGLALCPGEAPATPAAALCPDRVGSSFPSGPPARIEPLAPARYKVQFTASATFREKLERLQALMRSRVPDGDLARLLEEAVTEKLERLEARRFARTARPRTEKVPKDDGSRYLPAALRRAVNARDENRCRFVDGQGRRCPERHRLEYHHRDPFGRGGARTLANVCLMCRAHNLYLAEHD